MREKKSTTTIYKSGTVTKAGIALEKSRIEAAKRIDPVFNAYEKKQAQARCEQSDAEFERKKAERQ